MKKYFLFIVMAAASLNTNAQSAEDSVKATIRKMFFAMIESDGAMLQDCFTDNAIMQTITTNKEGKLIVRTDSVTGFIKQVANMPKGLADERIVFEMVKIDGPLATVWTPYKFYRRADFSHCGVNSFQLVRTTDKWRIQYIIDTRRKTGCVE
ncbi:hypothetical protein [Sediminibacterium sp. C3]|uniref:hypothetical protein n=1 Tax=Sediminibacterium sp. C3 TaxID=1267211 RepID=UPI0004032095|nr:hypothetical protein [Sediminibacterium sp. C3]